MSSTRNRKYIIENNQLTDIHTSILFIAQEHILLLLTYCLLVMGSVITINVFKFEEGSIKAVNNEVNKQQRYDPQLDKQQQQPPLQQV